MNSECETLLAVNYVNSDKLSCSYLWVECIANLLLLLLLLFENYHQLG